MYFAASPFITLYNENFQAFLRLIGQAGTEEGAERPESTFDLVRRSAASMTRFESITEWSKSILNNYWKFAGDLTRTAFQPIEFPALGAPDSASLLMIENASHAAADAEGYGVPTEAATESLETAYEAEETPAEEAAAKAIDADAVEPTRPAGGRGRRKSADVS